ncbi:MAG: hypothetical protein IT435_03785 [Phycisphaerales bacterium]|nr:hypothetical protein [Phycisphaerales bacterium]
MANKFKGAHASPMGTHTPATADSLPRADPRADHRGDGPKGGGPSSTRGRGFAYIGLEQCDAVLRKFDQRAKEMTLDAYARALGHEEGPISRFLHKLNALEKFRLIDRDKESLRLTPLAISMLNARNEDAVAVARAEVFFAYSDFKRLFDYCPKGKDVDRASAKEFTTTKLGILNRVDEFVDLFTESAHFAGLLEDRPSRRAETFRLRAAAVPIGASPASSGKIAGPADSPRMAAADVDAWLDLVRGTYGPQCKVTQSPDDKVRLHVVDGDITIELAVRIVIKTSAAFTELPRIAELMRRQGLKA